jgi:hypothetical protein
MGEHRLVRPGGVRRAEEVQQLGGEGLGVLPGRHGDVDDGRRVGHLGVSLPVRLLDGPAERFDGGGLPDSGHATEDQPAGSSHLMPPVQPHEQQALGDCAVEDRRVQRGQLCEVVASLVVVGQPLRRGQAAQFLVGE